VLKKVVGNYMVHDPISDILTQLRNASLSGKPEVSVEHSKLKEAIAKVLQEKGYLSAVHKKGRIPKKRLILELAYENGRPRIGSIQRVSKPSRRTYLGVADIMKAKRGGLIVLSTPKGVLADDEARKAQVGGEPLVRVM
jgi:small subunit ribosomal protein S8